MECINLFANVKRSAYLSALEHHTERGTHMLTPVGKTKTRFLKLKQLLLGWESWIFARLYELDQSSSRVQQLDCSHPTTERHYCRWFTHWSMHYDSTHSPQIAFLTLVWIVLKRVLNSTMFTVIEKQTCAVFPACSAVIERELPLVFVVCGTDRQRAGGVTRWTVSNLKDCLEVFDLRTRFSLDFH